MPGHQFLECVQVCPQLVVVKHLHRAGLVGIHLLPTLCGTVHHHRLQLGVVAVELAEVPLELLEGDGQDQVYIAAIDQFLGACGRQDRLPRPATPSGKPEPLCLALRSLQSPV